MPLYIKDDPIAALVATLAAARDIDKQEAVRFAVSNELGRTATALPLRAHIAAWRAAHPLPLPLAPGLKAEKAVFDELSGEI